MTVFQSPDLDETDRAVLSEIDQFRSEMRFALSEPKRWTGQLRRNLLAKAIQGSNSIEGYDVSDEDAVAAVEEEEPMTADQATWAEIQGYRSAMSYVLQLADDPHFRLDQSLLRSLHYMMLAHDLAKSPGRYRQKTVYVIDEARDRVVYEGPDFELVPDLMQDLVDSIAGDRGDPSCFVRAAMAHLNLVMIHPFRDGSGRMARCLQTLVLARDSVIAPQFSSIEEFLGRNTPDYYEVLARVGQGSWQPGNDATLWLRFSLRAHHMQAQTVVARLREASLLWAELDRLAEESGVPERAVPAMFDASMGRRLRRSSYVKLADVEERTASRDLQDLVDARLLIATGENRGRTYEATERLRNVRRAIHEELPSISDPYGSMAALLTS
ncbi:Fic family protein [Kibdelosporangium philippinense]|uniref:Fic family protein n=1 Tax=Kibdelosporangium philippinense TaxID=211113 RepID=A0ABS8ZE38_9PSEU|nr:Fic family protein [Kibdelosporangium philippinense]MCE7005338.1 Fic family protein [Kibdelosporangium philippinense]